MKGLILVAAAGLAAVLGLKLGKKERKGEAPSPETRLTEAELLVAVEKEVPRLTQPQREILLDAANSFAPAVLILESDNFRNAGFPALAEYLSRAANYVSMIPQNARQRLANAAVKSDVQAVLAIANELEQGGAPAAVGSFLRGYAATLGPRAS